MPASTAVVVMPAAAAIVFAFAALAVKRASQLGVDAWQTAFVVNMVGAVCYSFLWFTGGAPIQMELWWQPALVAVCVFAGMATQFIALDRGDVSVAVPVIGNKVLIVAFLTPFLVGEEVQPRLWISALLSVVGVGFLNWRGRYAPQRSVTTAIVLGIVSAFCFGTFDILVQKWGRTWGAGRLLPFVYWTNAVASLACIGGFRSPLRSLSRQGWKWLLAGAVLVAAQGLLFVGCLAVYGQATQANITYSARGLITVLLIWTIGHRFGSAESALPAPILWCRLIGAVFLLAAIVLAVWSPGA